MSERDAFSRKEIFGWGDVSKALNQQLNVEDLPNRIDPQIHEQYLEDVARMVDVILKGLHLEEHTVIQRKYNVVQEDTVFVFEFLRNILQKRGLKKLSYLLN